MISTKPTTIAMPATTATRISGPSTGHDGAQQLPGGGVAAAVLDVGDELHDHPGEQPRRDQPDELATSASPGPAPNRTVEMMPVKTNTTAAAGISTGAWST